MSGPIVMHSGAAATWLKFPHRNWKALNPEKTSFICLDCGTRREDAMTAAGPVYFRPTKQTGPQQGYMGAPDACCRKRKRRRER